MKITRRQLSELINRNILEEGSRRDAQGTGILVRETINAIVEKIKKIESLNKNVKSTDFWMESDLNSGNYKKVTDDIKNAFSELSEESEEILENARKKTLNKNSSINKLDGFKIKIRYAGYNSMGFLEGLKFFPGGGGYNPYDNTLTLTLGIHPGFAAFDDRKRNNYGGINEVIEQFQSTAFHEIHHFKQSNEFNKVDLRGAPKASEISYLDRQYDDSEGLMKYSSLVKTFYLKTKREILVVDKMGELHDRDFLKKTNDFVKSIKRISPIKDQLGYLAEDFLRLSPLIFDLYNKYRNPKLFLVYYYFTEIEIEAWAVGMMRVARIRSNTTNKHEKASYKNMTKKDISFKRKSNVINHFYNICQESINKIKKQGQDQIKIMYEDAYSLQKIGIDLQSLLARHNELCNELVGLWFRYAIKRYGIFKEYFNLEKIEIKKWKNGGWKAGTGMNPAHSLKPKFEQYIQLT